MKKVFLFLLVAIVSLGAFSQTRKVAILETVDREGKIPYGVKLIIRSSLAKGVADTKGYEAFERTQDLGKIFDEQNFQKTGNVSDEEIRKIGEMTGVQYVLVAEASLVNSKKIYVTAKILNVETARVEMTDGLMMSNNVNAVQKGAKKLGAGLLKPYYSDAKTTTKIAEEPTKAESKENGKVTPAEPEPVTSYLTIERISKDEYKLGDRWMTRKEYYAFINNRDLCIPAYQQFQKGLKLEKAGKWTLIAGGGFLFLGTMITAIGVPVLNHKYVETYYEPRSNVWNESTPSSGWYDDVYVGGWYDWTRKGNTNYWYAYGQGRGYEACVITGPFFMGIGAVAMITGGSIWAVGVHKKDKAYKVYNDHCADQVTFNLIYSGTGLGLAINF